MIDYLEQLSEIDKIVNNVSTDYLFGNKDKEKINKEIFMKEIYEKLHKLINEKKDLPLYSTLQLMKMKEVAERILYNFQLSSGVFEKKKFLLTPINQIISDIISELKKKPDYEESDLDEDTPSSGGRRKTRKNKRKTRGKKRKTSRRRKTLRRRN
jgi:hypothetical protein